MLRHDFSFNNLYHELVTVIQRYTIFSFSLPFYPFFVHNNIASSSILDRLLCCEKFVTDILSLKTHCWKCSSSC
ncbi:hypothetical protein HanRHA438_Chr08g0337651 [Helianthus annuus]|nr:hypothetical protein HanRHA438_Chr08g0337651 [Helianthus annuus]